MLEAGTAWEAFLDESGFLLSLTKPAEVNCSPRAAEETRGGGTGTVCGKEGTRVGAAECPEAGRATT